MFIIIIVAQKFVFFNIFRDYFALCRADLSVGYMYGAECKYFVSKLVAVLEIVNEKRYNYR